MQQVQIMVAVGILSLPLPSVLFAQSNVALLRDRAPEARPAILVLGTAHFANPGRDLIDIEVEDVLTERRQKEIESVVEQLTAFRPTHVAVERSSSDQDQLDELYQAYVEGRSQLRRNETEQIGFRLAAALRHERVYAVDWNGSAPGDLKEYDWYSYAQAHDPARLAAISDPESNGSVVELDEQSIGSWLRQLNDPERLAADHRIYFEIALIGDEEPHVGANWVGYWYARNLRIFNNLVSLANQPSDRIVVIYGAGHAYLLRQFAAESGAFGIVDVKDVLGQEP